jgi:hypothetical protein
MVEKLLSQLTGVAARVLVALVAIGCSDDKAETEEQATRLQPDAGVDAAEVIPLYPYNHGLTY